MNYFRLQNTYSTPPQFVYGKCVTAISPTELPMVLLVEFEIPRLTVGMAVHRRLDFDRLPVPDTITPAGPG
mgnify:FL=1